MRYLHKVIKSVDLMHSRDDQKTIKSAHVVDKHFLVLQTLLNPQTSQYGIKNSKQSTKVLPYLGSGFLSIKSKTHNNHEIRLDIYFYKLFTVFT